MSLKRSSCPMATTGMAASAPASICGGNFPLSSHGRPSSMMSRSLSSHHHMARPSSLLLHRGSAGRLVSATASATSAATSSNSSKASSNTTSSNATSSASRGTAAAANSSSTTPCMPGPGHKVLKKLGITETPLWNTGETVVRRYNWTLPVSETTHSVVVKDWEAERVYRDGGAGQIASEMRAAFKGANKHGLLVVPIEHMLSTAEGPGHTDLTVFYQNGGVNADQHFTLLHKMRAQAAILADVRTMAVHLLLGLWDVHNQGLVLKDLKMTNVLYSMGDKVFQLSDAGLCCRIGDRFASGRDMGRQNADQMRRFREGRAINYPTQLAATNQPAIDIAAYAECLYEAATGGRPQEVEYAQRHQYGSSILQLAGKQVDEMCDEELRHYAQEAYFDRSVEMMEGGGWQRYVDEVIAPLDPLLAAFLRPMFVCREDRPSIDDLLDHPYIADVLEAEQEHIDSILPAWREQEEGACLVAAAVKHARATDAMRQVLISGTTAAAAAAADTDEDEDDCSSDGEEESSNASNKASSISSSDASSNSSASSLENGSSRTTGNADADADADVDAGGDEPASAAEQSALLQPAGSWFEHGSLSSNSSSSSGSSSSNGSRGSRASLLLPEQSAATEPAAIVQHTTAPGTMPELRVRLAQLRHNQAQQLVTANLAAVQELMGQLEAARKFEALQLQKLRDAQAAAATAMCVAQPQPVASAEVVSSSSNTSRRGSSSSSSCDDNIVNISARSSTASAAVYSNPAGISSSRPTWWQRAVVKSRQRTAAVAAYCHRRSSRDTTTSCGVDAGDGSKSAAAAAVASLLSKLHKSNTLRTPAAAAVAPFDVSSDDDDAAAAADVGVLFVPDCDVRCVVHVSTGAAGGGTRSTASAAAARPRRRKSPASWCKGVFTSVNQLLRQSAVPVCQPVWW